MKTNKTKLEKLINAMNQNNEDDFCITIGGYWTAEINGKIVRITFDWNHYSCLNEKCKLEDESKFKQSDLRFLYSVINGYLKGKYSTI